MLQTFEALLDERGQLQFTEPITLRRSGRVLITMLTEQVEMKDPDELDNSQNNGMSLIEFFRRSPL
ncbi:hypothetical protein CSA56_06580 [candidate division KSB3 bacterium]|uniref:Uncharacterized protein n=1 Tax=candidate division KSB3 bacterium TaxID=2044937 RepID=A0A2G6KGQ7_9BACT|nr:MAG: hypothetical protein CSA56_06580 [candidate division KSB3 bacterium]